MDLFNAKYGGFSCLGISAPLWIESRRGSFVAPSELKCAPCFNKNYCSPPESNASFPVEQEDYCLSLTNSPSKT